MRSFPKKEERGEVGGGAPTMKTNNQHMIIERQETPGLYLPPSISSTAQHSEIHVEAGRFVA